MSLPKYPGDTSGQSYINWYLQLGGQPQGVVAPRDNINETSSTPEEHQQQVAAEGAPLRVLYGSVSVGAQIADALVYQGNLIVVAVWGEGEIAGIDSLLMDDKPLPAGVTATHYLGTQSQTVNATLAAAYAASNISYTDALPGIAYSVIKVPGGASNGFPSFVARIRGRKLYDPRTSTTAYSDNPALALADFLSNNTYGLGKTVDWSSVAAVANDCDALVGGEKRRLIGLVCDNVAGAREWVDTLRTYASAFVVQGDSGVRLISDRPGNSVASFTASNIVANSMRLRKRGIQQVPTVMRIGYTNTTKTPWAQDYAEIRAAGVDSGLVPRRESTVQLPGIQRYSQAYREAIERINKLMLGDLTIDFDTFDEALAVEVGDIITVTHPIGLSSKLARVTAINATTPGRWHISAVEYDPAMYSDVVIAEPTYADTDLPSPAAPPAVSGVTMVEEVYQQQDGTWSSRWRVTWTAQSYPYLAYYRVELWAGQTLIAASSAFTAEWVSGPIQEGVQYAVKVASVTTIGVVGNYATQSGQALGKQLVPGDVPSVSAFEAGGRVYVSWQPAIDIDIWRYEVRYGTTSSTWDSAKLIDRVDALRLTSDQIPVGTWRLFVKALDSVGQYSANAATVDVTVTSDANSFLVDTYEHTSPTLTNMVEYNLGPTDTNRYFVTEDYVTFGAKFASALGTYSNALATYHNSLTSTWLGEAEDFGLLLGGQWTGTATVSALNGSVASSFGYSTDGSAWTYAPGLSQKVNARFARIKHEALTTSTMLAVIPTQSIRVDAIPREEVGSGTSSASGPVTITLSGQYVALKKITITPQGNTARSATFDNVVLGNPTTFDVYVFGNNGDKIVSQFQYTFQGV